jgi:hypothetical protein
MKRSQVVAFREGLCSEELDWLLQHFILLSMRNSCHSTARRSDVQVARKIPKNHYDNAYEREVQSCHPI